MLSSLLTNDKTVVFSYIQWFQLRAVTNFHRSSLELKIRFFNNLIQLDVWYQPAAKRSFSWDKSIPPGIQQEKLYIYNHVTKEKVCDKPDLLTLSRTLEALNIHALTNGVSTSSIPRLDCGLDRMISQEVLKLLRDIFAYADVQVVVYTLEEHGLHAMSAEGDAECYSDDEIKDFLEEFLLQNSELETDFTKDSKSCLTNFDDQFPVLRSEEHNNRFIDHCLQNQPKELASYVKDFDFWYSDIADEDVKLLIDLLVDARDIYSQHKFDVGKTRQKLSVTLKRMKRMFNWNDSDLPKLQYT